MSRRFRTFAFAVFSITPQAFAGSFTVGVEATDYLPISKGDAGDYRGYARDILDAFATKYGHTLTYKPLPVARLLNEFVAQKSLDFKFPDNPNWSSDAKKSVNIVYSKSLMKATEGLLVKPANKGKLISPTSIVIPRGFTPYPYLDGIQSKKITVTEVSTTYAAIKFVDTGRAEGAYLDVTVANYIMDTGMKQPGVLVFDEKLPKSNSIFSLSSISHPEVIKQMDEFLSTEKKLVAKLKAKYKIVE